MTVVERVFPAKEVLLPKVKSILASYSGTAVTVRQIYYRLVAVGAIPNSLRSYKNLVNHLTKWRWSREIPMRAFEDRTRGMNRLDDGWRNDNPLGWLRAYLKTGLEEGRNYHLARWYGQEHRVVVAVEKQALEGPFTEVCEELDVDLVVCRGYPSISFLREVADALSSRDQQKDGRDNVVVYFGDLDPSGLNIPETLERDLNRMGQVFDLSRIALTHEQVDEMDLIPAPVKMTDSRAEKFVEEHGEEVYELDAIEPKRLQDIIRDAVNEYFDGDQDAERIDLEDHGKKLIEEKLAQAGVLKFVESLSTDGGDKPEDGDEKGS